MNFFIELLLFIFTLVWFIYLPSEGLFSFTKFAYRGWKRLSLGLTTGIVLIIFVTYCLATIGLRDLVPVILSGLSVFALVHWRKWSKLLKEEWKIPHVPLLFFAFLFSLFVVTSGWVTSGGMLMRSVNGQDGIWNIALARELKESFPPQHPSLAGIPLKGYHIFYNLWLAQISRMVPISLTHLHYHFAASLMALLFVYGIYALCSGLTKNKANALWGTFFAVFGGSFSFILPFVYNRTLSFDDAFGITQPFSLLLSPTVTLSIVVLIWLFLLLSDLIRKKNVLLVILVVLFAGVSVGIKVYAGIIAMGVLVIVSGFYALFRRRWIMFFVTFLSGIVSAFVFFPLNASYGFLIYQFLWPAHRLMEGTLNFTNWDLKRQTLTAMGSNRGLLKLEIQAMVYFLLGNIGTRIIGFFGFIPFPKNISLLAWILVISLGISFTVPMFFIQPIGVFNMIQFFWYFMVFVGVFCGIGIGKILSKINRTFAIIFAVFIIVFTLPSAGWRLYFLLTGAYTPISSDQLLLYQQLGTRGSYNDVILELPKLLTYSEKEFTNWGSYLSLPYIPAFGNKRIFFGGEVVQFRYEELWRDRLPLLEALMAPQNSQRPITRTNAYLALTDLYNNYHVRYILTQNQPVWFATDPHFQKILHNSFGEVYRIVP